MSKTQKKTQDKDYIATNKFQNLNILNPFNLSTNHRMVTVEIKRIEPSKAELHSKQQ